jgi:putative SOS response-associated peptidase YedK
MINARAETVRTKPAFRSAFKARRCLIPAEGFYEWQRSRTLRQPHYIHRRDGAPMAFAGLWEPWRDGEETLESCAIITTESNALLAKLHNRMPVMLAPRMFDIWFTSSTEQAADLLKPCAPDELVIYPVSRRVNDPRNDGTELLRRVE